MVSQGILVIGWLYSLGTNAKMLDILLSIKDRRDREERREKLKQLCVTQTLIVPHIPPLRQNPELKRVVVLPNKTFHILFHPNSTPIFSF